MFSMRPAKKPAGDANARAAGPDSQTDQSALAARDARIAELERALAEERRHADALRETADSLRFKTETLEKSYAKQLADTRARLAAAEQALAEHKANEAAYGADREQTIRLLKEARAELEQLKLDRDQLRAQARRSGSASSALATSDSDAPSDGTINQLMAGAGWQTHRDAPKGNSHLDAHVAAAEEAPVGDMLAPELVFTKDKDGD
ncbi:MAG TPA: hypothetical protein VHH11_14970 [Gammaproteobacteria bacterium]|jgi:chromosome segregation ATPase|nr:hypothetical protein [Gammaproteobacteria bacterium]